MSCKSEFDKRVKSEFPFITVDGIIIRDNRILLIKRKNTPRGWALPGGFVQNGETLENAVQREVKEETGLEYENIEQFKAYSDPKRDPRFHTVTIVFVGTAKKNPAAASDAKAAKFYSMDKLPINLVFDHDRIIREYKEENSIK